MLCILICFLTKLLWIGTLGNLWWTRFRMRKYFAVSKYYPLKGNRRFPQPFRFFFLESTVLISFASNFLLFLSQWFLSLLFFFFLLCLEQKNVGRNGRNFPKKEKKIKIFSILDYQLKLKIINCLNLHLILIYNTITYFLLY